MDASHAVCGLLGAWSGSHLRATSPSRKFLVVSERDARHGPWSTKIFVDGFVRELIMDTIGKIRWEMVTGSFSYFAILLFCLLGSIIDMVYRLMREIYTGPENP
jgi:hypothetical protein